MRYFRTFRDPSWFLLFLRLYRILLHLLFLRFLRYFSREFLARKKNSRYFCDFGDICGHFGALLGFFSFKVLILAGFVILAIFAKKNLLANRLETEHVFIRIKMVFFLYALVFLRSATTNKTTEHI